MENFEAIGRYHVAQEQLTNHASLRARLLSELKEYVGKVTEPISGIPGLENFSFPSRTPLNNADLDKIGSLIKQITQANQNMLNAIEEINKYAEDANKPKIEIPKYV